MVLSDKSKEGGQLSELEESKRLLYVALTRARDRLYFSLVTNGSSIKPSRGSLAEVLPGSFLSSYRDCYRF
jgi:superfamily I DNA/RNA helicase